MGAERGEVNNRLSETWQKKEIARARADAKQTRNRRLRTEAQLQIDGRWNFQ
jgi:hypothetical protein